MKTYIDHIVISVKNLKKSTAFYKTFLGKPKVTKWDASWKIGETKLFLTFPYSKSPRSFDKHNLGLNHLALGVNSLNELKKFEKLLNKGKLKHSGIQIDKYSNKEFIWFDDPDKIRLEFYYRPLK
jgi:catechol-2,3-dioxygenase